MNPSATNALFVCCLLLVLFFIVGMMIAAIALLSQRARQAASTSDYLRYRTGRYRQAKERPQFQKHARPGHEDGSGQRKKC